MRMASSMVLVLAVALAAAAWAEEVQSGKNVGENLPAYDPTHIAGPDKGSNKCPV
ncbi:MAG: hypothetical protein HYZ53_06390 [Planctomycetes bacterium]|nr:hypothetical protein [Planctomycetota bacterium]